MFISTISVLQLLHEVLDLLLVATPPQIQYANNWPKKFHTGEHKNRSQNIVPLKPPACVQVNFWNPLVKLEPPISDLIKILPGV